MGSQYILLFSSWTVLFAGYLGLLLYRKQVERSEDDTLHVLASDSHMVSTQQSIAHKMEVLERWSKILLAVVIVYGLAIGCAYLYHVWQANSNMTPV